MVISRSAYRGRRAAYCSSLTFSIQSAFSPSSRKPEESA
jgi:hypothetical protein